jgi:hypothetical protein
MRSGTIAVWNCGMKGVTLAFVYMKKPCKPYAYRVSLGCGDRI